MANLSLGGGDTEGIDPVEEAVNILSHSTESSFVIAAGNSGARRPSAPGSADAR